MTSLNGLPAVAAICALLLVEEAGVPLPMFPADGLLITAGVLIAAGTARLWLIPLLMALDIAGALAGFHLARALGLPGLHRLARRFRATAALERTSARLQRMGFVGVLLGRLVPGTRVYTNLVAGATGVSRGVFVAALLPSAIAWVGTVSLLGLLLGIPAERYLAQFAQVSVEVLLVLGVGLVTYLAICAIAPAAARRPPLSDGSPVSRGLAALALDLAVVAALALAVRAAALAVAHLAEPDGFTDYTLLLAFSILLYVFLARRLVGATLGETLLGVRYLPRRRLAGEA